MFGTFIQIASKYAQEGENKPYHIFETKFSEATIESMNIQVYLPN